MRPLLILLFITSAPTLAIAAEPAPSKEKAPAEKTYPLRGVIVAIDTEKSTLRVKHETIPGFMRAMTMQFRVTPTDLKPLTVGQAITATLYEKDDDFWLRDIALATK